MSVTTNSTNGGIWFQITIDSKKGNIPEPSRLAISQCHRTPNSIEIKPFNLKTPITVQKSNTVWIATFTVSPEALTNAGICFLFTEVVPAKNSDMPMPALSYYIFMLQEFLKPEENGDN